MPTPRYVLVTNPGTKRCETYHRELLAFWAKRGVTPEVELIGCPVTSAKPQAAKALLKWPPTNRRC